MVLHGIQKHRINGLKHCSHCSIEKSLMERVNQYFKDRIDSFDDYYPMCGKDECNLLNGYNWIQFLFLCMMIQQLAKKNYFITN